MYILSSYDINGKNLVSLINNNFNAIEAIKESWKNQDVKAIKESWKNQDVKAIKESWKNQDVKAVKTVKES